MMQMSVSTVVETLKDSLLGNVYGRDREGFQKGLVISLDLRLYREPGGDGRSSLVHFLFTGSTNVWMLVNASYRWEDEPLDKWENTSNHNSCWRTDGISSPLNKLFLGWARSIDRGCAPKDMFQFNSFSLCNPLTFVKVRHEMNVKDKYYRQRIIEIVRE